MCMGSGAEIMACQKWLQRVFTTHLFTNDIVATSSRLSHRCLSRKLRNPTNGNSQHCEIAPHKRAHDGVLCPRAWWRWTTQRHWRESFQLCCSERRVRLVALP